MPGLHEIQIAFLGVGVSPQAMHDHVIRLQQIRNPGNLRASFLPSFRKMFGDIQRCIPGRRQHPAKFFVVMIKVVAIRRQNQLLCIADYHFAQSAEFAVAADRVH